MSTVRLIFISISPPNKLFTAAVAMVVRGQSALAATLYFLSSADNPKRYHTHIIFANGIRKMIFKPFQIHI